VFQACLPSGEAGLEQKGERSEEMTYKTEAFTLIELLIVLVIIGILTALAVPNFTKTRERALDRDAQTTLRLIQAGEKIYYMNFNSYYPASGVTENNLSAINANLSLSISAGNNWNYSITGLVADFNATAQRPDNSRTWWITKDAEPNCINGSGGIPCP
jgi:prepilin-type N-terminal cleavage/methylation domain-containing protein